MKYNPTKQCFRAVASALLCLSLLSSSCTRAEVEGAGEEDGRDCSLTFGVKVEGGEDLPFGYGTRSLDPLLGDGGVDRLDIFSWYEDGSPAGHVTFLPGDGEDLLDLGTLSPTLHGGKDVVKTYLALANLDPDSARYLSGLSSGDLAAYPTRVIPWSAGNCRPDRPVMGATARVRFGTTQSCTFELRRYCCKIELGTITLAIPDMSPRDMRVTRVALTNGWDMLRPCMVEPSAFTGDPSDLFGALRQSEYNLGTENYFGYYGANVFVNRLEAEEMGLRDRFVFREKYSLAPYGGTGKLSGEYDRVYSHNYMSPMYTMYLTGDPALREVSVHATSYEGSFLSRADGTVTSPVTIGRTFQTLPTHYTVFSRYNEPVDNPDAQQYFHRLVIAVDINGREYYYPIIIDGLLPGRHYVIENITLRGEPSLFCNTWVKGRVPSLSGSAVGAAASPDAGLQVARLTEQGTIGGRFVRIRDIEVGEVHPGGPCVYAPGDDGDGGCAYGRSGSEHVFDGEKGQKEVYRNE